jgi:hypothetical protein
MHHAADGAGRVPNSFAFLMLALWPLVVLVLFMTLRAERAFLWSIIGGYLILPPVAVFDVPLIPNLDKTTIPALSAFIVATVFGGHRFAILPESPLLRLLVLLFVLSPFATALTNGEQVILGGSQGAWGQSDSVARILPGLTPYDGLAMAVAQAFLLITFAMARHFLATPAALREFLIALMLGGLFYTPLMLLEIRLSPQLSIWIYGVFQHDWVQMVRSGGFRPIVFLPHGLWVAFFLLCSVMAAAALARHDPADRPRFAAAALWMLAVLSLCKTLGVMVFAAAFLPVLLLATPRTIVRLCVVLAVAAFAYPLLRLIGVIPVDQIVGMFAAISQERAGSLEFRFDNEKVLLDHALEKPWFGWGAFERNLVLDPQTGRPVTISDGRWVIVFGILGTVGFAAEFGLFLAVLALLARLPGKIEPTAAAVALILTVNLVDLLPNATMTPVTWLMLGALVGHVDAARRVLRRSRLLAQQTRHARTVL